LLKINELLHGRQFELSLTTILLFSFLNVDEGKLKNSMDIQVISRLDLRRNLG